MKNPKTDSNLLKLSVTIKIVTKLPKPIRHWKIITQQPNKIVYMESKITDHTLKLDLIKSHIFSKKCSQRYKTKI